MVLGYGKHPIKGYGKTKADLEKRLKVLAPHIKQAPMGVDGGEYVCEIKLTSKATDRVSYSERTSKDTPKEFLKSV